MKRAFLGLAAALCLIAFGKLGQSPRIAKDWMRFVELGAELDRDRNRMLACERHVDELISLEQDNQKADASIRDGPFKAALRELRQVGWAKASVQSRLAANAYVKAHPKFLNHLRAALALAGMRARMDEDTRLISGITERKVQLDAAKAALDRDYRRGWVLWGLAGTALVLALLMAGGGLRRYAQESDCGTGELLRAGAMVAIVCAGLAALADLPELLSVGMELVGCSAVCALLVLTLLSSVTKGRVLPPGNGARLLLALGPGLAAAFGAASLLIIMRSGAGSFPWLLGAWLAASISALVWAALRLPDWAPAVFVTDGPSWSSDFRVFPLARGAGLSLYFFVAGALCFVMSLALSTFVELGSPGQGLLMVSALAGALLTLFGRLGRGGSDAARGFQLVVLAGVAWAAAAGAHRVWHGRAETLKRELRAKGHPGTLADHQENRADDQFANPAFQSALLKLGLPYGRYYRTFHPGLKIGLWSEATLKSESAAIALDMPVMRKEVFPILDKSRALEKMDFVRAAANPYATYTPKYALFMLAANILNLDSVARARRGDMHGAWDDLRHAAAIADLAAPGPNLVGRMIAVANRKLVAQAAINIALNARAPLPPDLADRLRRSLSDRLVVGGLGYEAARMLDLGSYFEGCRWADCETGEELTEVWIHPILGRALGLSDIFALRTASIYRIDDSWPDWATMRANIEKLSKEEAVSPYFKTRRRPFISGLFSQEWAARVWTQLALLSSAAVKFRAKAGRYPRALGELSPEFIAPSLLLDPFSGRVFVFKGDPEARGFELSSVGPEGNGLDSRGMRLAVKF